MWQNKNVLYAYVFKILKFDKIFDSNFKLFKTCFLSNLEINVFENPWRMETFIVPWNELCNAINHMYDKTILKMKTKVLYNFNYWYL
jgi:hypothetical protein